MFWARDSQLIPDELLLDPDINTWNIIAGRGFGKTRTGAESVRWLVENAGYKNVMLVGRTEDDVRDTMIEGSSGLLSIYPPWNRPKYEPSNRLIYFPNGVTGITRSADVPDQIRGQNTDLVWGDEIAAWQYAESYDQIQFGNRVGHKPLQIYTTTPRPTELIKNLVKSANAITTSGSTYDNLDNLAKTFIDFVLKKYEGTRLGQQELLAKILDDIEGALWKIDQLARYRQWQIPNELRRIVVGVDPAVSTSAESDETGIIVAGVDSDGHGYVLQDASGRYTPLQWAKKVVTLYEDWQADKIIAEKNNGGDLVESNIRTVDHRVPVELIHAKRSKKVRAQPIAGYAEKGLIHHIGYFPELESQLTEWVPDISDDSPDRLDAMVYALSELMLGVPKELRGREENPFYPQ